MLEQSFQNWGTHRYALSCTTYHFKDRFLSQSDDAHKTSELRKQSEYDLKRCLTWWDRTWFGFGSVIGADIFVLPSKKCHDHAGPSIILSYVISGISAMLSIFCYMESAVEILVAGGLLAYLRVELRDFAAFITTTNILLESIVGSAAFSRSWKSFFTSLLNKHPNSLHIHTNLTKGNNLLNPIDVVILAIAMARTRKTLYLNWVTSAVNTLANSFVLIARFAHADTSNQKLFFFGCKRYF